MARAIGLGTALVGAAVMMAAVPGHAQTTVEKEIVRFRVAEAALSRGEQACKMAPAKGFANFLSEGLQKVGLKVNPQSRLIATVSVATRKFGVLQSQCAYNVTFQFQTRLAAQEINTPDPRTRAALDRLGSVPVVIYQDGLFGVVGISEESDGTTSTDRKVREAITFLVDRFTQARNR